MNWSEAARVTASKAALALLNGGTLCLYAGDQQAAELGFADPAFHGDTMAPLAPDESAEGTGQADLDGFVGKSKAGETVCEGTVGKIGSGADCEVKFLRIPSGARVETDAIRFVPGA